MAVRDGSLIPVTSPQALKSLGTLLFLVERGDPGRHGPDWAARREHCPALCGARSHESRARMNEFPAGRSFRRAGFVPGSRVSFTPGVKVMYCVYPSRQGVRVGPAIVVVVDINASSCSAVPPPTV
ncbi:unnamed protein product [Arctogadus glacialis]